MDPVKSVNEDLSLVNIFKIFYVNKFIILCIVAISTIVAYLYYSNQPTYTNVLIKLNINDEIANNYSQEIQRSKIFSSYNILNGIKESFVFSLNDYLNDENKNLISGLLQNLSVSYSNEVSGDEVEIHSKLKTENIDSIKKIIEDNIESTNSIFANMMIKKLDKVKYRSDFYMQFYIQEETDRQERIVKEIEQRLKNKKLQNKGKLLDILRKNLLIAHELNIIENETNVFLISIEELEKIVNLYKLGTIFLNRSILFLENNYQEDQLYAELTLDSDTNKMIQQNNLTLYEITSTKNFLNNYPILTLSDRIKYNIERINLSKKIIYSLIISFMISCFLVLVINEYRSRD